ncbi:hypothetical protein ABFX02_11G077600 [Erythranthe guttata]
MASQSLHEVGEAKSSTWTANLNNLFSALETNVTLNNGYCKAEAGEKGPDKVYGLIQCRGDISMSNCADCTRNSFNSNSSCRDDGGRRRNRRVMVYQRWCLMRYSNESFFGVWEKSIHIVTSNRSFSEEQPAVAAKGRMMMMGLVAVAPGEGLMFAKAEMEDGMGGKRYGLAQCTRDLVKSDCRDCLEFLLRAYGSIGTGATVVEKRSWGIFAEGCFMLYDDIPFTPIDEGGGGVRPSHAANRALAAGRLATAAITTFVTAIAFL